MEIPSLLEPLQAPVDLVEMAEDLAKVLVHLGLEGGDPLVLTGEPPVELEHEHLEPAIDPGELFVNVPELFVHSGEPFGQDRAQILVVGWTHTVYLPQPLEPFKRIGQDTRGGSKPSEARTARHAESFIAASACSSQNRMSISRYNVVAVVRCSCASSHRPLRR